MFAGLAKAGLDVVRMEDYAAADERPLDLCLRDVAQSDIYVGLYAWRYGYIPPLKHGNPEGRSITELEYRKAEECRLRKLLFFIHADTHDRWPDRFKDDVTGEGARGTNLAAFRQELGTEKTASFFRTPDELATLVLAAIMRSGLTERPYNVPPRPLGFVARPDRTQALIDALVGKDVGAAGANTLVQGPGGFGKTVLVIDACHRPEIVSAFPDGILWTALGKEPNLAATLRDLHVLTTGAAPNVAGIEAIGQAIAKALEERRCLLVVDDTWRAEDLKPLLHLTFSRFVVTSRVGNLLEQAGETGWAELLIDEMHQTEALALLERGLPVNDANRQTLLKLGDRLGCWPLLLELANARLLEEYRTRQGDVTASIDRIATLLEQRGVLGFDRRDSRARNAAVTNSIQAGLTFADDSSPGVAQKAAELSIVPEGIAIPVRVLADLWKMRELDVEEDIIRTFDNLRIVRWDRQDGTIHLHDLVHRALKTFLGDNAALTHQRLLDSWGNPQQLPHKYAWQWICWHLREANRSTEIRALLLNVSWIEAKIRQVGLISLLQDMDILSDDDDIIQVKAALLLSTSTVSIRPELLTQQLESRLAPTVWRRLDRSAQTAASHRRLRSRLPTLAQVGGPIARLFSLGDRKVIDIAKLDRRRILLACDVEGLVSLNVENGDVASFYETNGLPCTIAVSDDGHLVAYVLKDSPEIHLVDGGIQTRTLFGKEGKVRHIALCGDGKTLIATGVDGTIRFWDTSTGAERQVLSPLKSVFRRVCAINGTDLAAIVEGKIEGDEPGLVRLFGLDRCSEVAVIELRASSVSTVLASDSGRTLACVHSFIQPVIALVDVPKRRLQGVLTADPGKTVNAVSCIAFSADDRFLLAGTLNGEVLVWDIETTRLLLRIDAHHNRTAFVTQMIGHVVTVGWTPSYVFDDPSHNECNVKVWTGDIEAFITATQSTMVVERHHSGVSAIAVSEDDNELVSGSYDATVAIWDIHGPQRKHTANIHGFVHAVSLNKKANVCVGLANYARECGVVNAWSLSSYDPLYEIETSDNGESVALTPDGNYLLIGTAMTLDVHALSDGTKVRTITISNYKVEDFHTGALCFLSDSLVAVGLRSGVIQVWNHTNGEKIREIKAHNSAVVVLCVFGEQRLMVSIGAESETRLWDGRSGTLIRTLSTAGLNVVAGAASSRAPFLLTAGNDGVARVWELEDGREVASFSVDSPLKSCAISSDGTRVFLGDMSGCVHFLRLEEC